MYPRSDEGRTIVLQEQPLLILRILIELKGDVATRDDIKDVLWPDDRTVDFNHSTNVAIATLRRALGDSAGESQYIVTVARRGYRLIPAPQWVSVAEDISGSVIGTATEDSGSLGGSPMVAATVHSGSSVPAVPGREGSSQTGGSKKQAILGDRIWIGLVVAAALLVVGGIFFWRSRHAVRLTPNDTVVLADISNQTSDPVFDDALNTALRVEFEQTPFLHLLGPDKVRGTMKLLKRPDNEKVTPEAARAVCLHTDSQAVIASSIADAGNRFRIELSGIDCRTGKTLAKARGVVLSRNDIVHTVGSLGEELRIKMGEPKASVAKFGKPLDVATSSSLEALQLLTTGYRYHIQRDPVGLSYYRRAIDLDPKLALAYAAMGALYSNLGDMSPASAAGEKAFELRDRLTGPTRFLTETLYYGLVTGDLEKAYPVYLEWTQTFPLDVRAHINFAFLLINIGQYDRASAEARDVLRLLPFAVAYASVMQLANIEGQPELAISTFDEAEGKGIDAADLHNMRHFAAFLQRDKAAMEEQVAWAEGKTDTAASVFWGESDAQAYDGRFRSANQWLERGKQMAVKGDLATLVTERVGIFALQEAEVGAVDKAKKWADDLPAEIQNRDIRLLQAMLFARTGEVEKAQRLSDTISREFPQDTTVQNYYLPVIRATIRLKQNDPAGAIETLRDTTKYELGGAGLYNSIYPAYLRGLAYLQMGNGALAVPEFQKLLDHPGVVGRFIIGALAQLQLARAQTMTGDRIAARQSYEKFLSLWKDADADIPIYWQAKAEYSRLG
jgi:DNA-binding winged helix-turn-helix (wHTH) protein/tetratricopeptide (TPR) repeat protein